jgi:integrase
MQEWYWAILMLAHSGCRATEVVQLLHSDIQQEEGIWFFNVVGTGEGRQLKNRASVRQVPIHSNLLKAGFLEWYQSQTDKRLFPLLFPYGVVKTTMTFTRLLRKLKLKRPSVTLHSLRHTMTIKLERARTHYSLMRRLLGHSIGKAVEDRVYFGSLNYSVKELAEAVEAVTFPPIA